MRRKRSISLPCLFLIGVLMALGARPAKAIGVDVEPHIALLAGFSADDVGPLSTRDQKYTGIAYGLKLAADLAVVRAGGIFEGASLKSTPPPFGPQDYTGASLGGFIGFGFPLFHVDLHYFLSSEWTGSNWATGATNRGELEFEDGSGFGVDLGFTALPFVNINLSFRRFSFDEATNNGNQQSWEYVNTHFLLGASFPIELI